LRRRRVTREAASAAISAAACKRALAAATATPSAAPPPQGPYIDGFGAEQHKFGPFGPIRAKLKDLAARTKEPSL
jgi:hypothetical protein